MFRSITSAVARWVTMARTGRRPPQWQVHTSMPKVRCSAVAQLSRGRFGLLAGHEAMFAELTGGIAESPADLQPCLSQLFDELKCALSELACDATGEHAWRDWTDRAALLWNVTTSFSKSVGHVTSSDERAARREMSRHARTMLLRKDRASAAEVREVTFR